MVFNPHAIAHGFNPYASPLVKAVSLPPRATPKIVGKCVVKSGGLPPPSGHDRSSGPSSEFMNDLVKPRAAGAPRSELMNDLVKPRAAGAPPAGKPVVQPSARPGLGAKPHLLPTPKYLFRVAAERRASYEAARRAALKPRPLQSRLRIQAAMMKKAAAAARMEAAAAAAARPRRSIFEP